MQTDGIAAETIDRSCLVCRHYRMMSSRRILCDQRKRVAAIHADCWNVTAATRAIRRAKACETFDDMRPAGEGA